MTKSQRDGVCTHKLQVSLWRVVWGLLRRPPLRAELLAMTQKNMWKNRTGIFNRAVSEIKNIFNQQLPRGKLFTQTY